MKRRPPRSTPFPPPPLFQSTKTASPDPGTAGTDETFTVKVDNLGPSDNAGFTLNDRLHANTTYVSSSATSPSASGTNTSTSTALAAGATVTYTIAVPFTPSL